MKLMVIDGNSIVNRSFYGVRPLTTRDGTPTNAVYGFVTTLLRLTEEEAPDALCVTFDRREPTFRHLAYDGYKAQRKGMPEELAVQMPILKEVLDAMDIPRYELAGYEADDLIGTISRKCEAAGWECVAVTGDKDSLQLVTDRTRVKLVSTRMGQTTTKDMTPEAFRAEYGFAPIHIIDLKALMGDTSDNIPGIKGVGEKTAMALVQRYETVDALYQALPDIEAKPGVIKKLTEGEESARMSYDLATIVTSAPLDFDPAANLCRPWKPELRQVFLRLEFNKLLGKLDLATPASAPAEQPEKAVETECTTHVEKVETWEQAQRVLEVFRQADHAALLALPDLSAIVAQCETGPDASLAVEFYAHQYQGDWDQLLTALFSADIKKVSHEVKDLTRTLLENGLPAEGFVFDTALAGYLLDATAGNYGIDRLFASWFQEELSAPLFREPDAFTALADAGQVDASFLSWVSAVDALYDKMSAKLEETGVGELYFDIELPLCRVLAEMELVGFRVDAGALQAFGRELSGAIAALEEKIYTYAGKFNINSPKQLGDAPRQADQDRLVHQRGGPGEAGAPHCTGRAGVPAVYEAPQYLCGRAFEGHRP